MVSPLQALPIELIEYIVAGLELSDIASVRLTSRIIEFKASQGCFSTFFKHRKVELTTTSLQDLVQVTGQSRWGYLLRYCTITGIIQSEPTAQDESTEHVCLLVEAFRNLKQRSPEAGLASLCLRVAVRVEDVDVELFKRGDFCSWRKVWDAALRTFHVTIAALHQSQLPVNEHLDVFGGLRGCSLACGAFLASIPKSASTRIFRSLRRLTVSLSASHKTVTEHSSKIMIAEAETSTQNWHRDHILQNILHVLCIMPELTGLDLHWYDLRDSASASPASSATRQESSISLTFPCLEECSLRGIFVSESDLLQFLEAVRPAIITLADVDLVSGTYASVFQYLTSPDSPVVCYHLDDVYERRALVHFEVPGSSKFRYRNGIVGPSSLTRQADHVKEAIRYRFAPGRALGSGERLRWLESKLQDFGPPDTGVYDFVALNSQNTAAAIDESEDDWDTIPT